MKRLFENMKAEKDDKKSKRIGLFTILGGVWWQNRINDCFENIVSR